MVRAIAPRRSGRFSSARTRRVTSSSPCNGDTGDGDGGATMMGFGIGNPGRFLKRARSHIPRTNVHSCTARRAPETREGGQPAALSLNRLSPAAAIASAAAATNAITARALRGRRARRGVLRPLDELLRLDELAVLVLRDELEADPATRLVDLLHDDVDDVAAGHHILDVGNAARADVRDVKQAVGALLQLDERAELRRLHDLAGVGVPHLRRLGERANRRDGGFGLLAVGRVDEERAVLLDVDLHLVVAFATADRLAALRSEEADLLLLDLDRRDSRSVLRELRARLRDRVEHDVEDRVARATRLLEGVPHDLLRDTGDLDVHLECGDAVPGPGDLEVHVAEVVLHTLDVGQDHVVVAFLDETHRDTGDRRLDRHAGVHERQRRAADGAHRRGAVRLESLGHDADRVREVLGRRDHRLERALRQGAGTDVTPLRAAHEARLPDRVRRE